MIAKYMNFCKFELLRYTPGVLQWIVEETDESENFFYMQDPNLLPVQWQFYT